MDTLAIVFVGNSTVLSSRLETPFSLPLVGLRLTIDCWTNDYSQSPLEVHNKTFQDVLNQLESYSGYIDFPEVFNSNLPSTLKQLELKIHCTDDEGDNSPSRILAPFIRLSNDYPHLESLSLHFELEAESIGDYYEDKDTLYLAALNYPSHPYSIICRSLLNSTLTSLRSLTLADSVPGQLTFTTHMYRAPRLLFDSILHFAPSLQRLSLRMCNDASDFGEHILFYTELKHYLERTTTLKCLVLPAVLATSMAGEPQELVKYLVQDASIEIEGEILMEYMAPITRPLLSLSIRFEDSVDPVDDILEIYESLNMVKHLQVTPSRSDLDFIPHIGSETTLTLTTVVHCDRLCQLLAENHRITTLYINPRAEGKGDKNNKEKFQAIIDVHPSIKNKDSVFVDNVWPTLF
ncbi:hypothetical protein SAMD00019534_035670 [Acytostelium subglobosum LB1]|uniref:hypothetical protein n=1 Tax=Acytostelium subglobosum LB1 TaxID=1410327 RepID=UPI000644936D|nr:hypothetical protein SAMD00019534_035670 [Acytostelium subglobosum LB1]GAM20392.1 hypothetical protein SAMD00019534_035670 [Acytostelium subglobosum LB1]|eukprot:XP_012759913.1 hypothetical protein SAMD00019534_035670 [Acytostelium subglobosum LB1]